MSDFCAPIKMVNKTRKNHRCVCCNNIIPKNSSCRNMIGKNEGQFYSVYLCDICQILYKSLHWDCSEGIDDYLSEQLYDVIQTFVQSLPNNEDVIDWNYHYDYTARNVLIDVFYEDRDNDNFIKNIFDLFNISKFVYIIRRFNFDDFISIYLNSNYQNYLKRVNEWYTFGIQIIKVEDVAKMDDYWRIEHCTINNIANKSNLLIKDILNNKLNEYLKSLGGQYDFIKV